MGMKSGKGRLLAMLLGMTLLLCGCRTRTGTGPETLPADGDGSRAEENVRGETISGENGPEEPGDGEGPDSRTRENPGASRKEYDESAPAEIDPGTERLLHGPGGGEGRSAPGEDAEVSARQVNDRAEKAAEQTVAAGEADRMGVSEDADAADSALTYFTVLLQDRTGSLFECKRQNAYWETDRDRVTIHRSSPEHALIGKAGCYDVSARLLPENLRVEDGWVVRKNPGLIIRIADGSVLGSGVPGDRAARALLESLRSREGWAGINAVRNRRILLLSGELLETPYGQAAALVLIAQTAYPDLFSDVNPEEMLQMLTEEATGTLPSGIFYYREGGA